MRNTQTKKNPQRKTRDRVLDEALGLFNDQGIERVTTRLIADTTGINEGNLYYYFRTKEALAVALFDRFEAEVLALFGGALPTEGLDPRPYTEILLKWFMLTWSYRFLFRDIMFLQGAAPVLQKRLRGATAQLEGATRAVFSAMQVAGLIVIPAGAVDGLLVNLWIVSTYWISYLMLHDGVRTLTPEHLGWGLNQVRSLYAPYLTEVARNLLAKDDELRALTAGYIEEVP
jgi:AcrR family transcriptional regulator